MAPEGSTGRLRIVRFAKALSRCRIEPMGVVFFFSIEAGCQTAQAQRAILMTIAGCRGGGERERERERERGWTPKHNDREKAALFHRASACAQKPRMDTSRK